MVIQERKMYLSIMLNQRNTCLVIKTIYPPYSYFFIGGSLQSIHQSLQCLMVWQKIFTPLRMPFAEREHFTSNSVLGRKHHLEAYILSLIAENSLPLSVVPKLVSFLSFCLEI